mmetsp:Transcript_56917/g.153443  ORF Transcript_56917/g.153443 Transcript_56917/m.153443 type:complete len:519 (-) Transcript_56917:704-2260(-)
MRRHRHPSGCGGRLEREGMEKNRLPEHQARGQGRAVGPERKGPRRADEGSNVQGAAAGRPAQARRAAAEQPGVRLPDHRGPDPAHRPDVQGELEGSQARRDEASWHDPCLPAWLGRHRPAQEAPHAELRPGAVQDLAAAFAGVRCRAAGDLRASKAGYTQDRAHNEHRGGLYYCGGHRVRYRLGTCKGSELRPLPEGGHADHLVDLAGLGEAARGAGGADPGRPVLPPLLPGAVRQDRRVPGPGAAAEPAGGLRPDGEAHADADGLEGEGVVLPGEGAEPPREDRHRQLHPAAGGAGRLHGGRAADGAGRAPHQVAPPPAAREDGALVHPARLPRRRPVRGQRRGRLRARPLPHGGHVPRRRAGAEAEAGRPAQLRPRVPPQGGDWLPGRQQPAGLLRPVEARDPDHAADPRPAGQALHRAAREQVGDLREPQPGQLPAAGGRAVRGHLPEHRSAARHLGLLRGAGGQGRVQAARVLGLPAGGARRVGVLPGAVADGEHVQTEARHARALPGAPAAWR